MAVSEETLKARVWKKTHDRHLLETERNFECGRVITYIYTYIPWIHKFVMLTIARVISQKDT